MGLQKVWVVHSACCEEGMTSAGACKCSPGEVHIMDTLSPAVLSGGKPEEYNMWVSSVNGLTCGEYSRLLTRQLRTPNFIILFPVGSRPWTYMS